jgi:hypothetical protein
MASIEPAAKSKSFLLHCRRDKIRVAIVRIVPFIGGQIIGHSAPGASSRSPRSKAIAFQIAGNYCFESARLHRLRKNSESMSNGRKLGDIKPSTAPCFLARSVFCLSIQKEFFRSLFSRAVS